MYSAGMPIALAAVAPHGGAWIEIRRKRKPAHTNQSPLTEGRGLKWRLVPRERPRVPVAPHGGAWIEISS